MVPLRAGGGLYIGIDIGSTSSDVAVLDRDKQIVFCDYRRTKGKPIETVRLQLRQVLEQLNAEQVRVITATGSAGRFLARLVDIPFVNEVPAQGAAISQLYPELGRTTVIDMGGQDSKLIFLSRDNGRSRVRDFALNSVCAAGTGAFLDQQADRLGISIEGEFGRLALQSKSVPRMAGRCSVFAKSDMIHLQQQATPVCDILAGLCLALARNLKSNLGCGREFVKPIVFTGGVAANAGVVRAMEDVFELPKGALVVPEEHLFTGAIGAVAVTKNKGIKTETDIRRLVQSLDRYLQKHGSTLTDAPRREPLARPALPPPESPVHENLLSEAAEPIEAYLGVDVGSLSTNVVVMDKQKRILAKEYLMTAGRPLEAIRQGLDAVGRKVAGKVKILGTATTGSGRYLTGDFIGADIVINEITAQATGAAIVNPKVDTIFEIGGQDSKYISLKNGVVVDFEMNHACAAGTGSFLEEQAQRLGISIKDEFANLAFASKGPIKLGERCTVFMESDLLSYQQRGAGTSDLVAGLSYSIVANYLNRVVGRRKIGDNICFQGGTAFNKAVWAAFEKVLGKPIMVPDHHEVTGALGAAAIAAEYMQRQAAKSGQPPAGKFRGFENLVSTGYSVESFTCEHCPNHCEIKKVQLPGSEPLYYGSRCDRYNLKKTSHRRTRFDAFGFYRRKLLDFAGLAGDGQSAGSTQQSRGNKTIGIPMALASWQLLPMFRRFFTELGFEVVLSGKTTKQTIRMGVESVTAQSCFPVKVAHGHIAELINRKVKYIFLPSIISMPAGFAENKNSELCPYTQSLVYQAATAFAGKLAGSEILSAEIRLGEGDRLITKSFIELAGRLKAPAAAARRAMKKALSAQAKFESAMRRKGREIIETIRPGDKLFVLVSRPYNGFDEGVNLQLPKKLAEHAVEVIPMEMLDLAQAKLSDEDLHRSVYWSYGQKILRAAELIKRDDRLFGIYLSNFSCGPDSFLMTFFKEIMADKPSLLLEIDEHSADAGIITRLEAFFESLKNYKPKSRPEAVTITKPPTVSRERTLYIPYMGDASYGLAACFRAYGQPAEVTAMADEKALLAGRAYTTGKECLPCAITTGEMLKIVTAPGFDARRAAFFMPATSGPCRFGMYNSLHKLILKYAGAADVAVVSPNQDSNFYADFARSFDGSTAGTFMRDLWVATVGVDLLHKIFLRIRPFALDRQVVRNAYDESLSRWVHSVEAKTSLSQKKQLMRDIAGKLAAVELDKSVRKPHIGVVGEIYVRNHPFANRNIIARLEQLGAACDLASIAEWIYYTNSTRTSSARRTRQVRNLLTNVLENHFQHKLEKSLAQPLEERFGPVAEQPVEHTIELARPYLLPSFEGEAILSIGKTVEYYKQGFGGVVNVMPFTCMPSTIVNSQTRRLSADCGDMPILNVTFDGQEDATFTTRLEAFVEQVASRQEANVTAAELISV